GPHRLAPPSQRPSSHGRLPPSSFGLLVEAAAGKREAFMRAVSCAPSGSLGTNDKRPAAFGFVRLLGWLDRSVRRTESARVPVPWPRSEKKATVAFSFSFGAGR